MNNTILRFKNFVKSNTDLSFIQGKGENKQVIKIPVTHTLHPPLSDEHIEQLRYQYPNIAPAFIDLYILMNGAELFACTHEHINPYTIIFGIDQLPEEKEGLYTWMSMADEVPEDWDSAVVFGGFAYTPDRFYILTEGDDKGKVFLYLHDPAGEAHLEIANNLESFLALLMDQPYSFYQKCDWNIYYDIFFDEDDECDEDDEDDY